MVQDHGTVWTRVTQIPEDLYSIEWANFQDSKNAAPKQVIFLFF